MAERADNDKLSSLPKKEDKVVYENAGLVKRAIAHVIDLWIMLLVIVVIVATIFYIKDPMASDSDAGVLVCFVILVMYHIVSMYIFSTTLGKRIFKLRVIDFKTKSKVSLWRIIIRTPISLLFGLWILGSIFSSIVQTVALIFIIYSTVPPFIYCMWAVLQKNKRAVHDLIARTWVVQVKK